MRIDNSAFQTYWKCPSAYYERYEAVYENLLPEALGRGDAPPANELRVLPRGIELISEDRAGLDFGSRFHQLVENQRRELLRLAPKIYPDCADERLEAEAQSTFAAYCAHYPVEPLEFLEAERTHTIAIPGTEHELAVKIDGVVRHADGTIGPLDTKTERSGSQANTREAWAGRTQASLYLWALQQLYPRECVTRLVVDVVTRGNSKRAPVFNRLDDISRPHEALEDAIRNVTYVCNEIERHRREGWWPSNKNICKDGWKKCEYYPLHVVGRTEANLQLYRPAEQYLDFGDSSDGG